MALARHMGQAEALPSVACQSSAAYKNHEAHCLGLWWNIWQLLEQQTSLVSSTTECLLHGTLLTCAVL